MRPLMDLERSLAAPCHQPSFVPWVSPPPFHPPQSSHTVPSKKKRFEVQNSPTAVLAMSVRWCPGVMPGGECVGCWMLRLWVATAAKALSQQGRRLPVRLEGSAASSAREIAATSPEAAPSQ